MDITALVVTTGCWFRVEKMMNTIATLSQFPEGYFKRKILSVDNVGEGLSSGHLSAIKMLGWEVVLGKYGSLVANAYQGLQQVDTEWVWYSEDDVWAWEEYPSVAALEYLEGRDYKGKKLGVIGFLEGSYDWDSQAALDYLADRKNYLELPGAKNACGYLSNRHILPGRAGKHDWWIQFPITVMRTSLFKELYEYADKTWTIQVERGCSLAWNRLGMDNRYVKVGFIRKPDFDSMAIGPEYASERGDRNLMFSNFREFKKGIPGRFNFPGIRKSMK